jgi:hypothetical protein
MEGAFHRSATPSPIFNLEAETGVLVLRAAITLRRVTCSS